MNSWLEDCEIPSTGVSLDKNDNDHHLFLSYFVKAIQKIFPADVHETEAMLNAAELPPVTVLSRSLINELDQIEKAFVLVLDDYHLVLVTRRDPTLPLTSLRSRGHMTEIRGNDLRFCAVLVLIVALDRPAFSDQRLLGISW